MKEYPKIHTIFKRDPASNHKTLMIGEYSLPEFRYLKDNGWIWSEKVDGTNIRVIWDQENEQVLLGGKTSNAQIPGVLVNKLREMFPVEKMRSVFTASACLYGEGYGAKIQKGGGNYRQDQSFVLFDALIDTWWLKRDALEEIAQKLGIDIVPVIGIGTLSDMVHMAETGFESHWGDFLAEGIVARPVVELRARNGDRIITKIKHKDFVK